MNFYPKSKSFTCTDISVLDGSLLEFWTIKNDGIHANIGFTILPFDFWSQFFYENKPSSAGVYRRALGIGIFSFFYDYERK